MRHLIIFILSFITVGSIAQEVAKADFSNRYVDNGLLRFQGNLAFGKPLTRTATNMYFAGDVDYYLKGNVSVNGGIFYFVNEYGGQDVFKQNHSLFAGFSYHFPTNNHLDPYVGIQPGVSLSRLNSESLLFIDVVAMSSFEASINPLFSVNAGMNFFANKYFNVFVNVKYQRGKHFSDVSAQSLEELKITLGLGYMLWGRKGYCKFRKPEVD
jgi:hypothetical protein